MIIVQSSHNPRKTYGLISKPHDQRSIDVLPDSESITESDHGTIMAVGSIVIHNIYRCNFSTDRATGKNTSNWSYLYSEYAGTKA